MKITLEQAENLVSKRNDLTWDGWTIVRSTPHNGGWLRVDGAFDRATRRWMTTKRFELQPDGTYIVPKAFGHGL
jgi:hypothetical protein